MSLEEVFRVTSKSCRRKEGDVPATCNPGEAVTEAGSANAKLDSTRHKPALDSSDAGDLPVRLFGADKDILQVLGDVVSPVIYDMGVEGDAGQVPRP